MLFVCQEGSYEFKPGELMKASKIQNNVKWDLKKLPMCMVFREGREGISD